MNVLDLVREDLRGFAGYSSARRGKASGSVWLNANESPWRSPAEADRDDARAANRYPEPQPPALRDALAALYGVAPEQVLVGRGSDEPIDLLVRALCRAGIDGVVVTPPVFGMYAICARLQNAPLIEVPLRDGDDGFVADTEAIAAAALRHGARLVFLCSPSNPTGGAIATEEILGLARRLEGRALLVVDEAYIEYASQASLAPQVASQPNIAVLRTLSKAHALAAARIGTLIATPPLIALLRNCQAPYPLPSPCVSLALDALAPEVLAVTRERVARVTRERARLFEALREVRGLRRLYPSQGNYLLARFDDAQAAFECLLAAGVVVRDMRASPQLHDALRISIGTPDENDAVLAALSGGTAAASAQRSLDGHDTAAHDPDASGERKTPA